VWDGGLLLQYNDDNNCSKNKLMMIFMLSIKDLHSIKKPMNKRYRMKKN
jgi:hypothetical protein